MLCSRRLYVTFAMALIVSSAMSSTSPAFAQQLRRGPSDGGRVAARFAHWERLLPRQRELLQEFAGIRSNDDFQAWATENEDLCGTFLADSLALSRVRAGEDGATLLDFVIGIRSLEGDRIKVTLDFQRFYAWKARGAPFTIERADGTHEQGDFGFNKGDAGGSLHRGFDEQGYTSARRVPRVQINFRESDALADIDIDYIAPLKWGAVPNRDHMTWHNSDVRDHLDEYVGKFGYAGFDVVSRFLSR